MRITLVAILYSFLFTYICAQHEDIIHLINPSFEDTPKQSSPPTGWTDCGFQWESPPDVHPGNYWEVDTKPHHGKSYLGMVVRNNGTWECISQMLLFSMDAGHCYEFSIYLAMSGHYLSGITNRSQLPRVTRSDSTYNFSTPAIIRIWGGDSVCERKEMLEQSNPIDHQDWKKYKFTFRPKSTLRYIVLEAYYSTNKSTPYNGNILLDNASDIMRLPDKE